jgi:hypothetical protein
LRGRRIWQVGPARWWERGGEVGELGRFGCCSGWFGWSGPGHGPGWAGLFLFLICFLFLFISDSVLVFENAIQIWFE